MNARLLVTIGLLSSLGCLPRRDLQPLVAVTGNYSLWVAVAGPTPAPAPKPGDKCKSCNGTGRVGDGRIWTECQACGGDGIVGAQPKKAAAPVSVLVQPNCENGQCKTTLR